MYPEVDGSHLDAPYAEHKYLYRNLRNGQFEEVTSLAGPGITAAAAARLATMTMTATWTRW